MMSRKWMTLALMPLLALVVVGCPKKKPPATTPDLEVVTEPTAPPPREVPPPEPEPMQDMTEPGLPEDIVELNAYVEREGLIGDVYFDFDRSDLRDEARARLAQNADFIRQHPELLFTIEGHCDERGTTDYNLALGASRAEAASSYLDSLRVDGSQLTTRSYGKERPVCTESTEACWQRNRRAHFVITGRR